MRISWFAPRNASNTPVAFIASTRAPAAMLPFAEEITNLSDIDKSSTLTPAVVAA